MKFDSQNVASRQQVINTAYERLLQATEVYTYGHGVFVLCTCTSMCVWACGIHVCGCVLCHKTPHMHICVCVHRQGDEILTMPLDCLHWFVSAMTWRAGSRRRCVCVHVCVRV